MFRLLRDLARIPTELVPEWLLVELRRAYVAVWIGAIAAGVVVLSAAFGGGIGDAFKLWWSIVGLVVMSGVAIYLAIQRWLFGLVVITTGQLAFTNARLRDLPKPLLNGLLTYVRFAAAIVVTELTVGMTAFIAPAHQNIGMALLAIPAILSLLAYLVWKGGGAWWPKYAHFLPWAIVFVCAFAVFLPEPYEAFGRRYGQGRPFLARRIDPTIPILAEEKMNERVLMRNLVLERQPLLDALTKLEETQQSGRPLTVQQLGEWRQTQARLRSLEDQYRGLLERPITPSTNGNGLRPPVITKLVWLPEPFRGSAGEYKLTVVVDKGYSYDVRANHPWEVVRKQADGTMKMLLRKSAGLSAVGGADLRGMIRVRFLENDTVLEFTRTR